MASAHEIVAEDGTVVPVRADSICVHSDTDGALSALRATRDALEAAGVRLAPFVSLAA
jgi:UPF0271 protein